MGTNNLAIQICNTIEEAPSYTEKDGWGNAKITKAVVVRNGMENGKDTVDIQFTTADGKKHIAMITGSLIQMLAQTINIQTEKEKHNVH